MIINKAVFLFLEKKSGGERNKKQKKKKKRINLAAEENRVSSQLPGDVFELITNLIKSLARYNGPSL